MLKVQSLQRTVTPARCIFLDGLTFNLKHVGQSHGAACCCMLLFTKYPRYLELGVENMDFRAVKWWQAPIDAAPSSSCPCECHSSTPHTLLSVPLHCVSDSAANRLIGEVVQSRRRPLLGVSQFHVYLPWGQRPFSMVS